MILRSQNQSRNEPISIRDLMKQYDITTNNNTPNQPPPSILTPVVQRPQQLSILKTIAEMPMPPPSHIQSETSIDVADIPHNLMTESKTPRRRKIFQQQKNKVISFNQKNRITNGGNIQSVINSTGQNRKKNNLFPTSTYNKSVPIQQQIELRKISHSFGQQNSIYNTVGSIKNKDIINISNSEQQKKFQQEQSGLSLKIRQPSADQSPQSSVLKQRIKSKIEESMPNINQNSNASNSHLHNSTLKSLIKQAPVPVYESQFHKTIPNVFTNSNYNSISEKLGQKFEVPIENHPKINGRINEPLHNTNISFNNIPFQNQAQFENRNHSFANFPTQQDHLFYRKNSFSGQNISYEKQGTFEKKVNVGVPVYSQIFHNNIPAQAQNAPMTLSPFDETEKEELKGIPKRFSLLQNKIQQQEEQIKKISQRLHETQTKELQAQKQLLNQLIKKQEQLNQKQKQINQNLEQIERLQSEQSLRKEQILKYELELQQARRLEDLHKQNERLYHQLIRRDKQTPTIKTQAGIESRKKQNSFSFHEVKTNQTNDKFKGFLSPFTIKHDLP